MSTDLVKRLVEEGATTIDELCRLMGLVKSSVYRYYGNTELRYSQLTAIFWFAKSDRVREIILDELLPASGVQVTWLPQDLDINGDGEVNTDDALERAINSIGLLHDTLKTLRGGADDADQLRAMREGFVGLMEESAGGLAVIDWLIKQALAHPRRRCRPLPKPRSNGSGVASG